VIHRAPVAARPARIPDGACRRLFSCCLRGRRGRRYASALVESLHGYISAYRRHIRTEEDVLIPIAEQVLLPEDWGELGDVFSGHVDPLLGLDARQGFDRLLTRIVNIVPPPLGACRT
jgi:hypothetical protein